MVPFYFHMRQQKINWSQHRINDTTKLFLDMPKDNMVVLAFGLFLVIISPKYRIVLPDNVGDLKQGIMKIL